MVMKVQIQTLRRGAMFAIDRARAGTGGGFVRKHLAQLRQLARMFGVQVAYVDSAGRRKAAEPEALLAVVRALGAPAYRMRDVEEALREAHERQWRRLCEPVTVAWGSNENAEGGIPARLRLLLPARLADGRLDCHLELEDGQEMRWRRSLTDLPVLRAESVEGAQYVMRPFRLPFTVPPGYHRLSLTLSPTEHGRRKVRATTRIIAAPRLAWGAGRGSPRDVPTRNGREAIGRFSPSQRPPQRSRSFPDRRENGGSNSRAWGVFLPLYALRSRSSPGTACFSDLAALMNWVADFGGSIVGTLPLLAAFLDKPFEPSPYLPVSRLFWNELYVDLTRIPGLEGSAEDLGVLGSPQRSPRPGTESVFLEGGNLIAYRQVTSFKRRVLEHLARRCLDEGSRQRTELLEWVAANPDVRDYARFRAVVEGLGTGWPHWPPRMRDGDLREGDYDPEAELYHVYVQWLADRQLRAVVRTRSDGGGLYLDMPLGVHPLGYDVWRYRDVFVTRADCGAPPDYFFPHGQNWGFPPMHPELIRERGYDYYIACVRNQLRFAKVLRLDHVMGLHRLYWIPKGLGAGEGVYVLYRAEEFYAILALESHRRQALLVGEDLGTVPRYIRRDMARHGIRRMYVLQLEFNPEAGPRSTGMPERREGADSAEGGAGYEESAACTDGGAGHGKKGRRHRGATRDSVIQPLGSGSAAREGVPRPVGPGGGAGDGVLRPVAPNMLACLNTHDMPPFANFWLSLNPEERRSLFRFLRHVVEALEGKSATLDRAGVRGRGANVGSQVTGTRPLSSYKPRYSQTGIPDLSARNPCVEPAPVESVLRAALDFLASSEAEILLVNLEDLWLEMEPHNVPGTGGDRPNWRRTARYTLEEFTRMPALAEALRRVDSLRKMHPKGSGVTC